jgi:WD40 repeat protein
MEDIHGFEDGLLSDVHIAYEDIYITDINSRIKSIESDDSGKLLALVEYDGSISIWECKDEDWRRTAAWKYKPPRQLEYKSAKMGPNGPLSSNDSINVIARWCHSSGRYLGVASNVSNKVHLFGENSKWTFLTTAFE